MMESTNKTASEILLEAAELLKQEGKWNQGEYFRRNESGGCMMCAHGAIAFCGNPEIKKLVLNNNLSSASPEFSSGRALDFARTKAFPYYQNLTQRENFSLEQYIAKHFGEVCLAHYKAFKVGLTYEFNDSTTTKQDVINKLREAALL